MSESQDVIGYHSWSCLVTHKKDTHKNSTVIYNNGKPASTAKWIYSLKFSYS